MKMHLASIVDIERLQNLMERFTKATQTPTALIDLEANVLVASGWQEICTKFHRIHPETCKNCMVSDTAIASNIKEGKKYNVYKCLNGLVDVAVPIIINNEHLGNLFIGQFLSEKPDLEFFRKQAAKYGFDEKEYLEALSKVPILSVDEVKNKMEFLSELAELIGDMGINKLELIELTGNLEKRITERTKELEEAQIATLNMMQDFEEARKEVERTNENLRLANADLEIKNIFFESAISACSIADLQGSITHVNPAFLTLWEYKNKEEAVGNSVASFFVNPDDAVPVLTALNEKGVWKGQFLAKRKNGEQFISRGYATTLLDTDGNIIGYQSANLDVTTEVNATENLKKTLLDLERSNKELEQFAYVASHDLQEPLRMISSYTQLLAKRFQGQLDEKADKYIHYAVDGAVRMQVLINDLLSYSRVTTRGEPFKNVDCFSVLGQAHLNLKKMIEENQAIIMNDGLPEVTADANQLVRVFQNLIANAIKFRKKETPVIRISAQQKDKVWIFSVQDNGIGIDQKHKDRIFIIFQRLHTRADYAGTGIGLAVCKRIINRHGGKIWVESEPGKGSTFYFTLPLKKEIKS